jgi:uncharacterized protein (DUF1778 family)
MPQRPLSKPLNKQQRTRRPKLRAVIPVSLPEADGKLIGRAATRAGASLSGFIRDAALERARAVMGETNDANDANEASPATKRAA